MKILLVTVSLLLMLLTSCASTKTAQPSATNGTVSSAAPGTVAATITLPDLTNQNADIARTKLQKLGLTDVKLASANPKYKTVIEAQNWTVVSMEPPAGTVVKSGDPVIVKVTKQ